MTRSTISDAALEDDNLLRIAEWCKAAGAMWSVMPVAEHVARPTRRVIMSISRGVGCPPLPWKPGRVGEGAHVDGGGALVVAGRTAGEAYGRTVDHLADYPATYTTSTGA